MKKKIITVIAVVLALSIFGIVGTSVIAENEENSAKIYSTEYQIVYEKDKQYSFDAMVSENSNLGAYYLELTIPDFITVKEVLLGEELKDKEPTFDYYVNSGVVSVICNLSNAVIENTSLFSIIYTVNEECENEGNILVNDSLFTDLDAGTIKVEIDFKKISVVLQKKVLKGDFNFDKSVDEKDLIAMQQRILSKGSVSSEEIEACDFDGDNLITLIDCQYIKAFLVGRFKSLDKIESGSGEITLQVIIVLDEKQQTPAYIKANIGEKYYDVLNKYFTYSGYEFSSITLGRNAINKDDTIIDSDASIFISFVE